jgi:hypothetical protein
MAIFYNNEVTVGSSLSTFAGVPFVSANNTFNTLLISFSGGVGINSVARVAFNNTANALTTAAPFVATFVNTAGTTISSGAGSVTFNQSLTSQPIFVIMPDRTSFASTLPTSSATITLTSNGYEGWGPNEVRLRNLGYF